MKTLFFCRGFQTRVSKFRFKTEKPKKRKAEPLLYFNRPTKEDSPSQLLLKALDYHQLAPPNKLSIRHRNSCHQMCIDYLLSSCQIPNALKRRSRLLLWEEFRPEFLKNSTAVYFLDILVNPSEKKLKMAVKVQIAFFSVKFCNVRGLYLRKKIDGSGIL